MVMEMITKDQMEFRKKMNDSFSMFGNNDGDNLTISKVRDGVLRLEVAHCCIPMVDLNVPVEFLTAYLSELSMNDDVGLSGLKTIRKMIPELWHESTKKEKSLFVNDLLKKCSLGGGGGPPRSLHSMAFPIKVKRKQLWICNMCGFAAKRKPPIFDSDCSINYGTRKQQIATIKRHITMKARYGR